MNEYHKIQTVYLRDPDTKFKTLLEGQWAEPEFGYLADREWLWTEKVDGTNVRVMWDGDRVRFRARTDDAQMPTHLLEALGYLFPVDLMRRVFPDGGACLYGEGYGAKIQKGGGRYIPGGCSFILFDVKVGDVWLERLNVVDVAENMSIQAVPTVGRGTLDEAVDFARAGFKSTIAADQGYDAEGLVMRPAVDLFDRRGRRIITKIKSKDFRATATT